MSTGDDPLDACVGGPSGSPFGDSEPARPEVPIPPGLDPGDEEVENPDAYANWLAGEIAYCAETYDPNPVHPNGCPLLEG